MNPAKNPAIELETIMSRILRSDPSMDDIGWPEFGDDDSDLGHDENRDLGAEEME